MMRFVAETEHDLFIGNVPYADSYSHHPHMNTFAAAIICAAGSKKFPVVQSLRFLPRLIDDGDEFSPFIFCEFISRNAEWHRRRRMACGR